MNPLDINQMSKNNKDLNVFTWSQKLSYQIVGQTASNMFIIIASNTAIQSSAIIFYSCLYDNILVIPDL